MNTTLKTNIAILASPAGRKDICEGENYGQTR